MKPSALITNVANPMGKGVPLGGGERSNGLLGIGEEKHQDSHSANNFSATRAGISFNPLTPGYGQGGEQSLRRLTPSGLIFASDTSANTSANGIGNGIGAGAAPGSEVIRHEAVGRDEMGGDELSQSVRSSPLVKTDEEAAIPFAADESGLSKSKVANSSDDHEVETVAKLAHHFHEDAIIRDHSGMPPKSGFLSYKKENFGGLLSTWIPAFFGMCFS